MIEKFSSDEIDIIKKELGFFDNRKTKAQKKYLYENQFRRIEQLTNDCEMAKGKFDVWYGVCALCDHAFHNYRKSGHPIEIINRYSTVWDNRRVEYGNMINDLIDIFEKYKNEFERKMKNENL